MNLSLPLSCVFASNTVIWHKNASRSPQELDCKVIVPRGAQIDIDDDDDDDDEEEEKEAEAQVDATAVTSPFPRTGNAHSRRYL